ncbi:MAG: response regulator transcription factor [Candidatus Lindowbacteria bacterium]|nr:response regulator transcription factor [Candidatus Lindowbacteria bacterium]
MIRVMVADDHAIIREGLRRVLEQNAGMKVVAEAENGIRALDLAKETSPDVIILDISMPEMDGFDCARSLRALVPHAKILVLTVHDNVQYAIRILEAGAHGFMCKDMATKDIIDAIQVVLAGRTYICPEISEKLASQFRLRRGDTDSLESLSTREFQVLRHLGSGHSLKDTARALGISEKTVSTYRMRILEKLNLRTNAQLIRYALEKRLIE